MDAKVLCNVQIRLKFSLYCFFRFPVALYFKALKNSFVDIQKCIGQTIANSSSKQLGQLGAGLETEGTEKMLSPSGF